MRRFLAALVLLAISCAPALAAFQPGAVVQLPNIAALQSGNYVNTAQVQVSGYYAANDGGEGTLTLGSAPNTGANIAGAVTGNSNVIAVNADPRLAGWAIGMRLSDAAGKYPANTFITALSATTVTVNTFASGSFSHDTLTVTCANGWTIFSDNSGNCFYRTNVSGGGEQIGITNGSAFDPSVFPTTVSDASVLVNEMLTLGPALGINNFHMHKVSFRISSNITVLQNETLTCDTDAGGPTSNGVYTGLPGSIMEDHGASVITEDNQDALAFSGCAIFPQWLANPAVVSGFSGVTFNLPAATYADMEAIRTNMILANDTALFSNTTKGVKPTNLWIYGFNTCVHFERSDHLNLFRIWCDGNNGIYGEGGGGQSDSDTTDVEPFVTKQVNSLTVRCNPTGIGNGSGGVCNEEYFDVASIAASPVLNSFGNPNCRVTLALGTKNGNPTVNFPGTDIKSSLTFANGDPISYPAWIANIENSGLNALGCLGTGPFAISVVSSNSTGAVVDLLGSSYSTGATKIAATANWDAGSQIVRIAVGDTNNLQNGMVIADDGAHGIPVGATIVAVMRSAKGPDPFDGYIAEIKISAPTTQASGTDTTVTFDGGAYTHVGLCDGANGGGCFFLNAAERIYSGADTAGLATMNLPLSNGHHYGSCYFANGTPGFRGINNFCFGHHYSYVMANANNCVFSEQHQDLDGEIDDRSFIGQYVLGTTKLCTTLGNGLGKDGIALVTDDYVTPQSQTQNTTTSGSVSSVVGSTITTSGSMSAWTFDAFGHATVALCQTIGTDTDCSNQADLEYCTVKKTDNTHLLVLACGVFFTAPQTYTTGAAIFKANVGSGSGWTGYTQMSADDTDIGLNVVEVQHGGMSLTNIIATGNGRNLFVSHNTTAAIFTGLQTPNTTPIYEDATALAAMHGCGNIFTAIQSWECTAGGAIPPGTFTPTGATSPTTLPNFGDRSLSILDFGGVPDWTTNSTTALVAAESAALAQGVHNIRLDCNAVGCGYVFNNHTVSPGIKLICPSVKAVDSSTNDYRNFPNALIMAGANGFTFSGSGEDGCNILQQNLATSAPPATVQDLYARQASFTGTGVKCTGVCSITNSMILGFDSDVILTRSARTLDLANLQLDGNKYINVQGQGPGGVDTITGVFAAPFTTRNNPLNVFTIPLTAVGDNGAGELRGSFASCTTTNCPLNGYKIWIRQPNGSQSAQGPWVLENVTATTADLVGSISAFNTGGYASTGAVVTAGSTKIILSSTARTQQMEPTQNVTASTCIPAGAQIAAVWRNYGIIYLDAAHPATCSTTETVTIADDSTGTFSVSTATLNAAGTNYQAGDELTLVGGTYPDPSNPTPAIILINNGGVDPTTGAILANGFTIEDGGSYTVLPGPTGVTVTGGSGTGATFNVSQAGGMVLDSSIRPGPGIGIVAVNSMNISGVNLLGGSPAISFGNQASGVKITNVKVNDENYLQDQTHIGIQFAGSSFSNSITNCGVYVFGYGLLSNTNFSGSGASPNTVSHCHLGGVNGASGLQGVVFSLESANPGTTNRQGVILDHNFTRGNTVAFVSDDLTVPSQINGNQLPQTVLYGQTDATTANVSGAGNVFAAGSMPIFASTPTGSGPRLAPVGITDLYLTTVNCPSLATSGSNGGAITIHLPPKPVLNCRVTFRPTTNTIIIDPNGNTIRTLNAAAVSTPVPVLGVSGSPQMSIAWDANTWELDGGAPDTVSINSFQNGQTLAHGQIYMSCTACSGGTGVLQVFPANGPGGVIVNGTMQQVPATGLFLPNSVFSAITSTLERIYLIENAANVTSIASSGGNAQLTLASVTGFASGDKITCVNIDETPLANVPGGDANTVLAGSTITLTDVAFVGNNTKGSCWWLGLIATGNVHATSGGVEVRNGSPSQTLVGEAFIDASHNLNDTATVRDVISWFNRQPKKMIVPCTGGATGNGTSTTTYKTPSTVCEGQFVAFGPQATPGTLPTSTTAWDVNTAVANSFLSGTEGTSACFGITALTANATCTAETEEAFSTQAVAADVQSANLSGQTSNLTEGLNFEDLAGFCTGTAPTCTYSTTHSTIETIIWQ